MGGDVLGLLRCGWLRCPRGLATSTGTLGTRRSFADWRRSRRMHEIELFKLRPGSAPLEQDTALVEQLLELVDGERPHLVRHGQGV